MNDKPKSNYRNFIDTEIGKESKANFLTDNTKKLINEKIIEIRSNKGLVGEPRIWNNLLSSQPLFFNLFRELYHDLDLATKVFQKFFANKVWCVTKIDFEYSSKRKNPNNSAFDVYIEYVFNDEKHYFGIEVKYQEDLKQESAAKAAEIFLSHKEAYINLTNECTYYK